MAKASSLVEDCGLIGSVTGYMAMRRIVGQLIAVSFRRVDTEGSEEPGKDSDQ